MHGSKIGVKCEATMSTSTSITTACHTDHALGPNFLVASILFLDLNTLPRILSAMLQDLSVQLLLCRMPFELEIPKLANNKSSGLNSQHQLVSTSLSIDRLLAFRCKEILHP
jgi:hypothetical protein